MTEALASPYDRPTRRWIAPTVVSLCVVLTLGLLGFAVISPTFAKLPAPDYPQPADQAEANRQDLRFLRRLPEIDRSFSAAGRVAFEGAIDGLTAQSGTLTPAQFEMAVTRAVALAGNGHTYVRGVSMGRSLNSVPLRMVWFDDGLFVVAARAPHQDLVGARILAIGGHEPGGLVPRLRPYVGGRDTRARLFSVNFLTSPAALHALNLLPSPDKATFEFQLADGARLTREIAADPRPAMANKDEVRWPALDLLPASTPKGDGDWRHVLQGRADLPLYLQQDDRLYWRAYPDPQTLFVAFRRTRNATEGEKLKPFLDAVAEEAAKRRPKVVIVDLRANTGGAYELASNFTEDLPKALAPDNRIYVLTGPDTFSAGIIAAARLKHFGAGRTKIVGRDMGDFPRFWSEGGRITLPNSQLTVRYSTAMHDWEHGCGLAEIQRCYWMNYLGGAIAAGDLSPVIPAGLTFADYVAGRDPALAAVALEGTR